MTWIGQIETRVVEVDRERFAELPRTVGQGVLGPTTAAGSDHLDAEHRRDRPEQYRLAVTGFSVTTLAHRWMP